MSGYVRVDDNGVEQPRERRRVWAACIGVLSSCVLVVFYGRGSSSSVSRGLPSPQMRTGIDNLASVMHGSTGTGLRPGQHIQQRQPFRSQQANWRAGSATQPQVFQANVARAAQPHVVRAELSPSLEERYATIAASQDKQRVSYDAFLAEQGEAWQKQMIEDGAKLGVAVDVKGGQVAYAPDFKEKQLSLKFDLLYVRHGKTIGNTEPRVYQGFVDEPKNALNEIGLKQAQDAADLMDGMNLKPDLVILSPLARATETGMAYLNRHPELKEVTESWDDSAEMHFGAWDNLRVYDLDEASIGHLFYLQQNAMVKTPNEDYVSPEGKSYKGENFVEMLTRAHQVLEKINARFTGTEEKRPLVLMYGHSMAGAAISMLCGIGKQVDGESYIGFDGKYILPNAQPVFLYKKE